MRAFAALAFFCVASLVLNAFMAWRLSSAGNEIATLESRVTELHAARYADDLAQSLRNEMYREAEGDAQAKYDAINGVPENLPDADWLDALRRGLRSTGGDGGADTAGKPDAANATPGATGGADAHR